MKQYKPRDKITQKMTRDELVAENQTTGEAERISKWTQDADFGKSPEQQAQQDAAQLRCSFHPSPLPHAPGAAPEADTANAQSASWSIWTGQRPEKPVKRRYESTGGSHRADKNLPPACEVFTEEELSAPELERYIDKSNKAADRLTQQRQLSQSKETCKRTHLLTKPQARQRPGFTLRNGKSLSPAAGKAALIPPRAGSGYFRPQQDTFR